MQPTAVQVNKPNGNVTPGGGGFPTATNASLPKLQFGPPPLNVTLPVTPGAIVGPAKTVTTLTRCATPAETVELKFVSPLYVAVSVFAPPVIGVRLQLVAGSVITQLLVPSVIVI